MAIKKLPESARPHMQNLRLWQAMQARAMLHTSQASNGSSVMTFSSSGLDCKQLLSPAIGSLIDSDCHTGQ